MATKSSRVPEHEEPLRKYMPFLRLEEAELKKTLPSLAKDEKKIGSIHAALREVPTAHRLYRNLAPIIWYKIANATHEAEGGSSFLGKPYEPNAIIKNDIECILMQRKPGGYRNPTPAMRVLSIISEENHRAWFQQVWRLPGASRQDHPAPFPLDLASRLIRMFSFVGDTVLDPFMGTGTTNVAAPQWGRNSIGVEIVRRYFDLVPKRLEAESDQRFAHVRVEVHES